MASDVSENLRERVARRADHRCEYCLIDEEDSGFTHQIDHIISRKHGGRSTFDNLAYACLVCNRYKGSDLSSLDPMTGEIVRLFHPRRDRWADHFRASSNRIEGLSEIGRATAGLLRMNSSERVTERAALRRHNRLT